MEKGATFTKTAPLRLPVFLLISLPAYLTGNSYPSDLVAVEESPSIVITILMEVSGPIKVSNYPGLVILNVDLCSAQFVVEQLLFHCNLVQRSFKELDTSLSMKSLTSDTSHSSN